MAGWTGFGDILSDSKDKKFEMWNGFGDVFGDTSIAKSSDGEPLNIQDTMGTDTGGIGFLNKFNNKTGETTQGWGMPAIQGVGALANAYLGYQQLQLGKSQLEQNKKIFNLNFGAQAQTLNTQMEDRQRARVASAGSGSSRLDSVDAYMSKNAIKTQGI